MKYDKAELNKVEDVLKPARKYAVCKTTTKAPPSSRNRAWKKIHKQVCKSPTGVAATEVELRVLHEGMLLLNLSIQEPAQVWC